jgi:hypothetical protein
MGLFDKIQDNAKAASFRALEESSANDAPAPDAGSHSPEPSRPQNADVEPDDVLEAKDLNAQDELADLDDLMQDYEDTTEVPIRVSSGDDEAEKANVSKAGEKPKTAETDKHDDEDATPVKVTKRAPKDDNDDDGDDGEPVRVTQRPAAARPVARPGTDTLASYASQLQMTGSKPIFMTTHMKFKTNVYVNRVEYSGSFGKIVLPVDKIAWIKLRIVGTGIIIETTTGKRVVMIVKPSDRVKLCDAVLKAQEFALAKGGRHIRAKQAAQELEHLSASLRELEKLADLRDKGVLSEEEFTAKKKQLLGL